jgi:hypothetical protein
MSRAFSNRKKTQRLERTLTGENYTPPLSMEGNTKPLTRPAVRGPRGRLWPRPQQKRSR